MARSSTLYVHAHPDDESLFTGGRTLLEGAQGRRQVLVTCTDGSLGFDPLGRTPLEAGHDRAATALRRSAELGEAVEVLGFDRSVELGFADSGMAGWATADEPGAFVNQPIDLVAAQLVELAVEEGPCDVVTYAADGFYGHPDHVHAHRCVLAAAGLGAPFERLELVVMTSDHIRGALEAASRTGGLLPEWLGDGLVVAHGADEVSTELDARLWAPRKQEAVAAHVSQLDNAVLAEMPPELFAEVFGVEQYLDVAL